MGCDIHTCLEQKRHINGEDIWVNIDPHLFDAYGGELEKKSIADGRDYELFSVLADVRNRGGAAAIALPKGIPEDAHKITMDSYECWSGDAHNPSYFTIEELKKYQAGASKKVKRSGLLSPAEYERFTSGEEPKMWCQGTNQPDYKHAEWESDYSPVDSFIEEITNYLSVVFWPHEIRDQDEKFRIVFWFDN